MSDERQGVMNNQRIVRALDAAARKLEAVEQAKREPVAIIGLSCRYPGGVRSPEAFWELLVNGRDAITEVPAERWDSATYYDPDPNAAGKIYTTQGGFLNDIDQFDPHFFGISPREAESMDPQQRLLLEVSWEALERAGQTQAQLKNSLTGVFVGITGNDYGQKLLSAAEEQPLDAYFGSGNALNAAAGRLSYIYGLQGPSMAIDTACSSSLVATHLACQSLRAGECDMALVGGVNLFLSPEVTGAIARAQMLSPDGRCKTFDEAADGYGRGEGCGVLVLKRLSDAQAAGDPMWALIRSSAVNQDGPSSGFTVPNGPAQEALLRRALAQAKIRPEEIDYVEAHGTGTALGDPIEVRALGKVLCIGRETALKIGSVKTNVGHTEAAAGVAGLIKTVLALRQEVIPPHLHLQRPSSRIPWDEFALEVPVSPMPWPRGEKARLAGVSSFGMSGTNAHVILEEAPRGKEARPTESNSERPLHLLALSSKTAAGLGETAARYASWLAAHSEVRWEDVAYSANSGRTHFAERVALVAKDRAEAVAVLRAIAQGENGAVVQRGTAEKGHKVAFLFTGQGSQYVGMGEALYQTQPVFREAFAQCERILGELGVDLWEVVFNTEAQRHGEGKFDAQTHRREEKEGKVGDLDETAYTQPALFAVEYALAMLWRSWGVEPQVVLGHSVGEYVAACVAGVFSLEQALKLMAARGRLMGALPRGGAMAAVFADASTVQKAIEPYQKELSIAAVNGLENVVISGERKALARVLVTLEHEGVMAQPLRVSHAFHSPLMEPMLAEFKAVLETVTFKRPQIKLISNIRGAIAGEEITTPEYWLAHVREAVQFAVSMQTAVEQGLNIFIEIGPQPILLGMGRRCLPESEALWLPSLRPQVDDWSQLLQSLGAYYVHGGEVDWRTFDEPYARQWVDVPTYAWQKQHYWLKEIERKEKRATVVETAVLKALREGDTAALLEQVKGYNQLSAAEEALWPRLLKMLSEQQQRQAAQGVVLNWLYQIKWERQRPLPVQLPPRFWPEPEVIETRVRPYMAAVLQRPESGSYARVLDELEGLSAAYIVEAWQAWGAEFKVGEWIETAALMAKMQKQHRRLAARTLRVLQEEGVLQCEGDGWRVVQEPDYAAAALWRDKLLVTHQLAEPEITMLGRCGEHLAEVLRGAVDPLQLLFPAGELTTAAHLYQRAYGATVMNELVAEAVQAALAELPRYRPLRVLEIGAGTGGTTAYILPHLPSERTIYTFTDISLAFTKEAQVKFADYEFVEYKRLDIEQEPSGQRFAAHGYDLIVAANVLHATEDIGRTMGHVRQLLAPQGLLMILEGTARMRWVDLIFGLTEGWWRFTDTDIRPDHALLSTAQWERVLREHGFSKTVALADAAEKGTLFGRQAVIVGKANDGGEVKVNGRWAVIGEGKLAEDIAFALPKGEASDPGGILFLRNEGEEISLESSKEELLAAMARSTGRVLTRVQEVLRESAGDLPQIVIATRGAIDHESSLEGLVQSPLWGLQRVLTREHPELRPKIVELGDGAGAAERLVSELLNESGEEQILWRDGVRHAARLARYEVKGQQTLTVRPEGMYLITGGLRGLGLLVAEWLVQKGARYVALVGRRAADAQGETVLMKLRERGAQVHTFQADVGEVNEMRGVMTQMRAQGVALRGVIHAAGALDDGMILQQRWERFERVMQAKVAGAWHLQQLTQGDELDFFVLFSTTVAVLGNAGQSNHAAANTFLDALAHYRQKMGWPGLSINWGAWSEVGAAARRQVTGWAGDSIRPQAGLQALEMLLGEAAAQVAVVPIDWAQVPEGMKRRPLVANFVKDEAVVEAVPAVVVESLQEKLARAHTEKKQKQVLSKMVQGQLAAVLGLTAPASERAGFFELGMDSLTAVEFKNKMQREMEVSLPATVAFDYPTVELLVGFLWGRLFEGEEETTEVVTTSGLDELSVDELAGLLDDELAGLV